MLCLLELQTATHAPFMLHSQNKALPLKPNVSLKPRTSCPFSLGTGIWPSLRTRCHTAASAVHVALQKSRCPASQPFLSSSLSFFFEGSDVRAVRQERRRRSRQVRRRRSLLPGPAGARAVGLSFSPDLWYLTAPSRGFSQTCHRNVT